MKKILALLLAALLIFSLVACSKDNQEAEGEETEPITANDNVISTTAGTFKYGITEEGEYEITAYEPDPAAVVSIISLELPKTTPDGREITGIAAEAFNAKNSISSVTIPETYKHIGAYAFRDCDALTTVVMTDSVVSIGEGAFQECNLLASVTMSKSVSVISTRAFMNCPLLTAIDLSGATKVIGDGAFAYCPELVSVTLSDSIESVKKSAFLESPKVTYTVENGGKYLGNTANPHLVLVSAQTLNIAECTVNANTKVIADGALANCEYLEKVTLGAAVKFVNATCFENSPYIVYTEYENARYLGTADNPHMVILSVIIPSCETLALHADVKIITADAFTNCDDLTNINYPKTTADWDAVIKAEGWSGDKEIAVYKAGDTAAQ